MDIIDNFKSYTNNNFEFSSFQIEACLSIIDNKHVLITAHTGSGKTLVYFEALKPLINKGFQGLILLPEIGLTSQFEQKFLVHIFTSVFSHNLIFGVVIDQYVLYKLVTKSLRQ